MLPEPSLAFGKKKAASGKSTPELSFFYDPDSMPHDPSSGLYGPPNPLKRERADPENELFVQGHALLSGKKPTATSTSTLSPLGPFALALAEHEQTKAAKVTAVDQKEKPKSTTDIFLPPWSPLEDATLIYFMQQKSNDAHANWPYLCEFLNTQYHHRQCIRHPESAKARLERLLVSGATILSDDERKSFALKSFENLMYCFAMMKKRIRTKPMARMGMGKWIHFSCP